MDDGVLLNAGCIERSLMFSVATIKMLEAKGYIPAEQ